MIRGTHSTAERVPILGETVGPYRIVGVLGDGRLGHLYVAEQNRVRGVPRVVALRCVRPELAQSSLFRARFQDAARLATRCEHPSLLRVFELGEAEGRHFVSMEYLPGESVESILHRCGTGAGMPADIAAYVVKQVGVVLQALAERGEASPQSVGAPLDDVGAASVFVSHHGTVKWHAWGLRRLAHELGSRDAERASPAGGPRPVGNERAPAAGEGDAAARRRSDVASLGRLLWACLVGDRALASAVTLGAAASNMGLPRLPAGVPDALGSVVRRALSPDPLEQLESPGALADELDRFLFQRDSRPTPRHLRRWMEQLFGAERGLLQLRVARGRDLEAALSHLGAALPAPGGAAPARAFSSPRPRELWLTRQAAFSQLGRASIAPPRSLGRAPGSAPEVLSHVSVISMQHPSFVAEAAPSTLASAELPPRSQPRERPARAGWWAAATLGACAVVAVAALLALPPRSDRSAPGAGEPVAALASASGGVEVRSTPEGAAVFIDGEPTGLSTPVVLRGLAAGRTIRVRVDKAGFQSREQALEVVAGSVVAQSFELSAATGQLRFINVPADARVYVDDALAVVLDGIAAHLSVGSHTVRVETPSALLFSGTVDVVPGEQTLRLDGDVGR